MLARDEIGDLTTEVAGFGFQGELYERQPAPCPWDLDDSGAIDFQDLLAILVAWGPCADCPQDFDGDGVVGFQDLLDLLGRWGACP